VLAGFGWLYLLREGGVLGIPPRVPRALGLQQLAGDDAQPLARMALAWLAGGALIGSALEGFSGLGRLWRTATFALTSAVLLVLLGAAADALTNNQRLSAHITGQLGNAGSWVALGLLVTGFELGGRLRGALRSAASGPA